MSIIKKASILIITAAAALFSVLPAYAEENTDSSISDAEVTSESSSQDKGYSVSGDYKYSVHKAEDGTDVAFLEEYAGKDTDIVIPETIDEYKVTGLGDQTFYQNYTIKSITISENLEDVGYSSFYGCTALTEFKVNEKNPLYTSDSEGALVGKQGLLYLAYPIGKNPESITIPDGFVAINASAFAMCKSLKEVKLPDTLEYTGDFSFSECTSLKSVEFPDSVTEIKKFSFSGCSSLESVKFSKNLQTIGDAAFANCEKLEIVEFPDTLMSIGQAAFCASGLTSVTIPSSVSSIGYSAFGFYTDATGQIVQNNDFVIKGYNNSGAQMYCTENNVLFVALDEEETAAPTEAEKKKAGITPGMAAGICVICIALIITIAVIVIRKSRGSKSDVQEDDEETDDSETDDTEDE